MNEFSFYRNKRVLITGFKGFLGTEIMRLLSGTDCRITGATRSIGSTDMPPSRNPIKVISSELGSPEFWNQAIHDADIVFHLAAQTSLELAQHDPEMDYQINVLPMKLLLAAADKLGKKIHVVFAGTATQAGVPKTLPLNEQTPDQPITVYDLHKLEAEQLLSEASCRGNVSGVSLRLCNLYGPGPMSQANERGLLNKAVAQALQGKDLEWYEGHDFMRDYLFITDAAEAFLAAGEKADQLSGKYFVLGSGHGWKFSEAFKIIADTVERKGVQIQTRAVPASKMLNPIHCRNVAADSSAFQKAAGWIPKVSLPQGIARLAEYAEALHSHRSSTIL